MDNCVPNATALSAMARNKLLVTSCRDFASTVISGTDRQAALKVLWVAVEEGSALVAKFEE
jgi:hypothetical protein